MSVCGDAEENRCTCDHKYEACTRADRDVQRSVGQFHPYERVDWPSPGWDLVHGVLRVEVGTLKEIMDQ